MLVSAYPGRATFACSDSGAVCGPAELNLPKPDIHHIGSIKTGSDQGFLKSLFHFDCINEGFNLGSSLLGRSAILQRSMSSPKSLSHIASIHCAGGVNECG
jgi:hypothetical protein